MRRLCGVSRLDFSSRSARPILIFQSLLSSSLTPPSDFTATTIMERFQNASAGESVERVLKKISTKKAEEIMKAREPKLPSTTFVSSYLGAFRPRECGANVGDQQELN